MPSKTAPRSPHKPARPGTIPTASRRFTARTSPTCVQPGLPQGLNYLPPAWSTAHPAATMDRRPDYSFSLISCPKPTKFFVRILYVCSLSLNSLPTGGGVYRVYISHACSKSIYRATHIIFAYEIHRVSRLVNKMVC